MHHSQKLISFIALRANGWSLVEISYKLNVPKSTLWEWDTKHQDQILRLKQLQLEKFRQRFLPTYEEELAKLALHLNAIEAALRKSTFDDMHPGYLLQLSLQLRNRLAHICSNDHGSQAGSDQPLPVTGCITRNYEDQFTAEDIAHFMAASPQSAAEPNTQNQTKPDGTPPSPQNGPFIINDLQPQTGQSRPVLPPHNEAAATQNGTDS